MYLDRMDYLYDKALRTYCELEKKEAAGLSEELSTVGGLPEGLCPYWLLLYLAGPAAHVGGFAPGGALGGGAAGGDGRDGLLFAVL